MGGNVSVVTANDVKQEIVEARQTISWQDIFVNNAVIALMGLVPVAGVVEAAVVQYNTGWTIGAYASAVHVPSVLYVLNLLLSPVGILEYLAYIVLLAESVLFLWNSVGHNDAWARAKAYSWRSLLFGVGVLLLAAVVEEAFFLGR
jgi:uncharacterized membrane protein SpoIIM required for sporulation